MKTIEDKIVEFCNSVKKGFGSIPDSLVKAEFNRIHETTIASDDLGKLLALLEKHNLIDKKHSVNKDGSFYQFMYKKMKINENVSTASK